MQTLSWDLRKPDELRETHGYSKLKISELAMCRLDEGIHKTYNWFTKY